MFPNHCRSFPRLNLWIDILLLIVFLMVFESRATGITVHEWLGIVIMVGSIIHILLHWRWITCAFSRFLGKLSMEIRLKFIIDMLIFIGFTSILLSGLLISRAILPSLGFRENHSPFWPWLHHFSVDITLFLVALHIAMSWRWIVRHVKKYILVPMGVVFHSNEILEETENAAGSTAITKTEKKTLFSFPGFINGTFFYLSRTLIILFFPDWLVWDGITCRRAPMDRRSGRSTG